MTKSIIVHLPLKQNYIYPLLGRLESGCIVVKWTLPAFFPIQQSLFNKFLNFVRP